MSFFKKSIKLLFEKPTAKEVAVTDLEENKRQLIKEIAAMHYHQRMVDYYYAVIAELQEQIK
jgi:phosphoribosyl-ATP pyrophosphohydrolase